MPKPNLHKIYIHLIGVIIILIASGCALQIAKTNQITSYETTAVNAPKEHSIILRIIYGDDTIEQNYELRITNYEEGETVWRIMQRTLAEKGIDLEYEEYGGGLGALITKIGDKKNGDNGRYWQYFVNGKYANTGASNYKVNAGDLVEWKFTNNKLNSKN